jgi:S1-C subfamily serine protease
MQVYQEIKGVVIGSIQPASPADKAGLQAMIQDTDSNGIDSIWQIRMKMI